MKNDIRLHDSLITFAESCTDKIKNQDEENIDCGGSSCATCPPEEPEETCTDGMKNQDEDDIDCGGACDACQEGKYKLFFHTCTLAKRKMIYIFTYINIHIYIELL